MINCKDKKLRHWSSYVTEGWGLVFNTFTYHNAGYIKNWYLSSTNRTFKGITINELINTFDNLIKEYNLKRSTENNEDLLVVYTDNLPKVFGFLENYGAEYDIDRYFHFMKHIEIRPCWYDTLEDSRDIAIWAQYLIDNVFVPDKYFYITPTQIPRKRMKSLRKRLDDNTVENLFPKSFESYNLLREAFFGGILYVPHPGKIITEPLIEIDLKSAYIFCMIIEKHCMSTKVEVNPDDWEYYLTSANKASFGRYRIKYSSYTKKISCFKNYKGEKLQRGEDIEDLFTLTDVDLKIMIENVTIHNIECLWLYEYELDFVPKYVRDMVVADFIKKEELKLGDDNEATKLQKIIVNAEGYGDSCRNCTSKVEFDSISKDANLAPQWGVWSTSYCRRLLLGLGKLLDGWYYSATDSIYCKDTEENVEIINKFNEETRKKTKAFCDKFGYDYEKLKDLGCFIIKTKISKFKAFGANTYMYTTEDGEIVLKASGCPKKYRKGLTEEQKEALYLSEYIPVGETVRHYSNHDFTECDIDGIHYESNGSYYDIVYTGLIADYVVLKEMEIKNS